MAIPVAHCGFFNGVRKKKAIEGLRYKELDTRLYVSLKQKHWVRQMEETRLRDVSVGQNVPKINAWHRWHWVIQRWTAQATGTLSVDREELPNSNQSGLPGKGLRSETFAQIERGRVPAPSHPRKGSNSFLCKCLEDQHMAVHFHGSQSSTTFQRHCCEIAPIGSFCNESVRANSVSLKFPYQLQSLNWRNVMWKIIGMEKSTLKVFLVNIASYHPQVRKQRLEARLLATGVLSQAPPPTQVTPTEHLWHASHVLSTYGHGRLPSS